MPREEDDLKQLIKPFFEKSTHGDTSSIDARLCRVYIDEKDGSLTADGIMLLKAALGISTRHIKKNDIIKLNRESADSEEYSIKDHESMNLIYYSDEKIQVMCRPPMNDRAGGVKNKDYKIEQQVQLLESLVKRIQARIMHDTPKPSPRTTPKF